MAAQRKRRYKEHYPSISVRDFLNQPLLAEAKRKENKRAHYTVEGLKGHYYLEPKKVGYGVRFYLLCAHCDELKERLYIYRKALACSKCLKLYNLSNTQSEEERLMRRIRKERRALWGDHPVHKIDCDNLLEDSTYWLKPKGIHWKTFKKKHAAIRAMEDRYMNEYLMPMMRKLTRQ